MEFAQSLANLVESVLTSAAIFIAGVWGVFLFRRHRRMSLRADLALELTHAPFSDAKRLLHVALGIVNKGAVLLQVRYAEIRVRQIRPIPADLVPESEGEVDPIPVGATELPWPQIVMREWPPDQGFVEQAVVELEPDESDFLHADFVIREDVSVIQLYAFVQNPSKARRNIGWTKTMLYTFDIGAKMMDDRDKNGKSRQSDELEERQQKRQPTQTSQQPQQQKTGNKSGGKRKKTGKDQ